MKRNTILLLLLGVIVLGGGYAYYHYHGRIAAPPAPFSPITNAPEGPPPGLLSQLPADAPVIFYADLAALRTASFSSQLAALAPEPAQDRDYTAFAGATGFDYARDLDRVAMAGWPRSATATALVAVAEGRFDREKIRQYALRSGTVVHQGSAEVYEMRGSGAGQTTQLTFLGSNRIALAEGMGLEGVRHPAGTRGLDDPLAVRAAKVAGASFFLVARTDGLPAEVWSNLKNSAQLERLLRSVRFLTLAGQPQGADLDAALDAECDSTSNAWQLATLLDSLRLLGRAALSDPKTLQQIGPQAITLLDALLRAAEVSRQGKVIQIRVTLTPAMLNAALPPRGKKNPS
jgi:hypothetical protein